jgi:hypothetical protein
VFFPTAMFEPNEYTSTSKTCICCPVVDSIFTFCADVMQDETGLVVGDVLYFTVHTPD